MSAVPDTREEFEDWWSRTTLEGQNVKDPYLGLRLLVEALDGLDVASPRRVFIEDTLIDWLASDDSDRWQPALGQLTTGRVRRAAPVMREVAATTNDRVKLRFADTFRANAEKIERSYEARPSPGDAHE